MKGKFGGDITLKVRFDVGTTRSRYVIMPLLDPARVIQGCNASMPKVVAERTMIHGHGSCSIYGFTCLAHLAQYV